MPSSVRDDFEFGGHITPTKANTKLPAWLTPLGAPEAALEATSTRHRQVVTALRDLRQSLARRIHALEKDLTHSRDRLCAAEPGEGHPEVVASLWRRIRSM